VFVVLFHSMFGLRTVELAAMGVGVIGELWPERADAAAVFCLHAPTRVPNGVRTGTPVQLHVAAGDRFTPADQIATFRDSADTTGATASVYEYRGAGHFFTDFSLPDYSATATARTWTRVLRLLDAVS
jgi:dienelactone hydrolase